MPKPEGNRKKIKGAGGSRAAAAAAAGAGGSKSKAKRKGSKGAAKQAMSAAQLYEAAQAALAVDEYERALECLRDALQLEPENLELLDAHGALLAELGRTEEAVAVRLQQLLRRPAAAAGRRWGWACSGDAGLPTRS